MKHLKNSSLFLILIVSLLLTSCGQYLGKKPPKAIDGVLDLTGWDFEKGGIVRLDGEWEFYWNELLEPEDFSQEDSPPKTGFFNVPGLWNGYLVEGRKLTGHGYATFRLTVKIREQQGLVALKIINQVEIAIGNLPPCQADPSLLKQVWTNLLSNAIKYTRGREMARIEIGYRDDGGKSVYYVRDNGVGFDMRYAHKLFGVFQRLHRAEEYEGTGVGLAIVQRIVHHHGGRVWAEAEAGKGATFYFTI